MTAASRFDVLIVGAGHAGASCAAQLRQLGFQGSVGLLTEEGDPPYERPPLSKEYLLGEKDFDRMLLRGEDFWSTRSIDLLLNRRAIAVDPKARTVTDAEGALIGYDRLVWATGGHARKLTCDGADLAGVHGIRTRADVDRLLGELPAASRVVVIGGGYIGLEAAAGLTKLGRRVTVLEALDRVLARVAGEPLSRFYEAEHRAHGVEVRLGARVSCLEGEGGRVMGVRLADGEVLPAHVVIVGIGIQPAVEPLLEAGARGGDGVEVDAFCRTNMEGVYAIGDCARHQNRYADDRSIRLESVQNANDMAAVAARDIVGQSRAYDAVPWFWSNQYDLRLQTMGLSSGYDDLVQRGDPASRSFSLVYLRAGRVIALDCVNATKDYVAGKALVAAGAKVDRARLADPETPLKGLAGPVERAPAA